MGIVLALAVQVQANWRSRSAAAHLFECLIAPPSQYLEPSGNLDAILKGELEKAEHGMW